MQCGPTYPELANYRDMAAQILLTQRSVQPIHVRAGD
jgi:hypothetical protein